LTKKRAYWSTRGVWCVIYCKILPPDGREISLNVICGKNNKKRGKIKKVENVKEKGGKTK
jgi:hypothetical protein